jgi:7-keto-8-aminopelargonate synthetase-like enzyme
LASHPRVLAAFAACLKKYGFSVAASRVTTGNHILYRELEQRLADFFGAPSALVVSSGYATNLVVTQALAGSFSHVLIDEHSHPSLSDAAKFFECPVLQFKHLDPEALQRTARRCGPESRLIVLTDGLFSRNGAVPPLAEYFRVLPADAELLVDEAHAGGILGRTGKGALEYAGAPRRRVIQTVTLSKALGSFGGAILGPNTLRNRILERSHLFAGSTPLPLPLACAALEALSILKTNHAFKQRLDRNVHALKSSLRSSGIPIPDFPGPIIALRNPQKTAVPKLHRALVKAAIFPSFIKYPGGPAEGYFRFVISSEHSREQLKNLSETLARTCNSHDGWTPV